MHPDELKDALEHAVAELNARDRYLLENNLSERCIAARIAIYLQIRVGNLAFVDCEYNKLGASPKELGVPEHCAQKRDKHGNAKVFPDIIVHARGLDGPNYLVVEIKKTTNRGGTECDELRVNAFLNAPYRYRCGAIVVCETRRRSDFAARVDKWITPDQQRTLDGRRLPVV